MEDPGGGGANDEGAVPGGSAPGPLIYQQLRKLINVVDDLRDVGLQQYVALPRICVLGTQSAGKSSVLESIVGIDFLPRGEGVVTRRPLELRLVHRAAVEGDGSGSDSGGEAEKQKRGDERPYAVFDYGGTGATGAASGASGAGAAAGGAGAVSSRSRMYDFEEVRRTIERLTDEKAGSRKGIVDDPIVLSIYGPQCPDLTLIDLPGITRVPLKNSDQADDIEKVTRDMALRYACDPRTIILAVVAANQDIGTSDALQLARRVDPKGVRTLGVLTKIDLMDRGTDACRMLLGEDVPLRLGFTGVRNRAQAEIVARTSVADALRAERDFFARHSKYRLLPPHMLGTPALVAKLTRVLFRHIRLFLPSIKREIQQKLKSVQLRLLALGEGVPPAGDAQVHLLWSLITDYCDVFSNSIRGKFDKKLQQHYLSEEFGGGGGASCGSEIRQIFNELLRDAGSCTDSLSDYDIDVAIRKHEGDSLPGFPSPDTFESLIVPHLRRVQAPVNECLDCVALALENLAAQTGSRVFKRFPRLMENVLEFASEILTREKDHTKRVLDDFVAAETGYLFTNDAGYLTDHGSMLPMTSAGTVTGPETDDGYGGRQQELAMGDAGGGGAHGSAAGAGAGGPAGGSGGGHAAGNAFSAPGAAHLYHSLHGAVSNIWPGGGGSAGGGVPGGPGGPSGVPGSTHYSPAFIAEIRARLDAYFRIVVRNVRDSVPKIIGCFLVRTIQEKLQFELHNHLTRLGGLSELLGEPAHIRTERESLDEQARVLQRAAAVLLRDPSLSGAGGGDDFDESFDGDLALLTTAAQQPRRPGQGQPGGGPSGGFGGPAVGGGHGVGCGGPAAGSAGHRQGHPQMGGGGGSLQALGGLPAHPQAGAAGGAPAPGGGGAGAGAAGGGGNKGGGGGSVVGSLFGFGGKKNPAPAAPGLPPPPQYHPGNRGIPTPVAGTGAAALFDRRFDAGGGGAGNVFQDPFSSDARGAGAAVATAAGAAGTSNPLFH